MRWWHRLKQATVTDQEDQEDQIQWRVEAEVRLAQERHQAAQAQQDAARRMEVSQLRVSSPCHLQPNNLENHLQLAAFDQDVLAGTYVIDLWQ
jgi:hypothetical protein